MKNISLVCTVHEGCGLANALGLRSILERLRPEVIFLETPPQAFDRFLNAGTEQKLESAAINQYRESNSVELVPVDLPTPDRNFFTDYEYLVQIVDGKSDDFRRLMTWQSNYVRDYGFPYLNSEHCSKMWSDIYANMLATIRVANDPRLIEIFDVWRRINDLRENEMLKNTQEYCDKNSFKSGVFLVGAAHRKSVIEKSEKFPDKYSSRIQWDFSCDGGLANRG